MRLFHTPQGISFFQQDIDEAAARAGFPRKGFNRDFVVDLAIDILDGKPLSQDEIVKAYTEEVKEKMFAPLNPAKNGAPTYFLETGSGSTSSLSAKKSDWVAARLKEAQSVQEIIRSAPPPPESAKNASPLDRAFQVLVFLREERRKAITQWKEQQEEGAEKEKGNKDESGNELEKISIFPHDPVLDGAHEEGADDYLDFLLTSQVTNRDGSVHEFSDKDMREVLRVASYMQDIRQISEVEHTYEPDPTGQMIRYESSRGLEDLEKIDGEDMTMGPVILSHNLICGEVLLKRRYKRKAETSVINVLIDRSGSMRSESKNIKALGVLWYLVKQVIKKKAIVIFSFFESDADNFHVLDYRHMTSKELRTWFFKAMQNPFEGGTTEVGKASLQAIRKFKELMLTEEYENINVNKAHLVLINDGEDDATDLTVEALEELDAILHGFILFNSNSHIEYLAKETGGFYCEGI